MGTLAKRLGQLSQLSFQSESASIFKTAHANKIPGSLSNILDSTLKDGHNMKVFGLGTLATMSSLTKYEQFLTNLLAIYSTMEKEFDKTSSLLNVNTVNKNEQANPIRLVWDKNEHILRRSQKLQDDINEVKELITISSSSSTTTKQHTAAVVGPSVCTEQYVHAIRIAGQYDRNSIGTSSTSGRLLGHFYCRYFADLFGGQMLCYPYQLSLQLPVQPRHLQFDYSNVNFSDSIQELLANNNSTSDVKDGNNNNNTDTAYLRKLFIEQLYQDINTAGQLLSSEQIDTVRKESLNAFQHNVTVYSEEPSMTYHSFRGGSNMIYGYVRS